MKTIALLLCIALAGCVTTKTTSPDGTVVTVRSTDPKAIKYLAGAVAQGAAQGISMAIEAQSTK